MQVDRSLKELEVHTQGLPLNTASKILPLHRHCHIGVHIHHSSLLTLELFLCSMKAMLEILRQPHPMLEWFRKDPCLAAALLGQLPGEQIRTKHLTQPSGADSARAGGGKEKCYHPEEPAGFLRCLLRKEEHFIARSVGISVLGRSVNLIQEYAAIYEEMKSLSVLPINSIAETL